MIEQKIFVTTEMKTSDCNELLCFNALYFSQKMLPGYSEIICHILTFIPL